jgi:hypothetical protein
MRSAEVLTIAPDATHEQCANSFLHRRSVPIVGCKCWPWNVDHLLMIAGRDGLSTKPLSPSAMRACKKENENDDRRRHREGQDR